MNCLIRQRRQKKIPADYRIPEEYRHNTPDKILGLLKPYQEQGYFKPFPFGTDLNDDDIALGGSLKVLKATAAGNPLKLVKGLLVELFRPIPESAQRHIERMNLSDPSSVKERIMRKMVIFALRNNNRL